MKPDISAPGGNIFATYITKISKYAVVSASCPNSTNIRQLSGTSMAAPYVAGCVALIKSYKPSLSPSEIKRVLQASAKPVQDERGLAVTAAKQGAGLINLQSALHLIDEDKDIGNASISYTPKCTRRARVVSTLDIGHEFPGYKMRLNFFEVVRLDNASKQVYELPTGRLMRSKIRIGWGFPFPVLITGSSTRLLISN
jgi:hypothetical protein